jgi:hypothetical protein
MMDRVREEWSKISLPLLGMLFFVLLIIARIITLADLWPGIFLTMGLSWLLLTRFEFDRFTRVAFTVGMGLYWWFFAYAGMFPYSPDIEGHLQYIAYMSQNLLPPPSYKGFLFYHPPLYYFLMGAMNYVFAGEHMNAFTRSVVRVFSIECFFIFLIYSIRIIRMAKLPYEIYALCLLLMIFWPLNIMLASRIDSNLLLYPLCTVSFYYLMRWHETPQETGLLARSLIFVALGIVTRTNAIVILGIMGLVILHKLITREIPFSLLMRKAILGCMLLIAIAGSINVGRNIYFRVTKHIDMPFVVGNGPILLGAPNFRVKTEPENYYLFIPHIYFNPPFFTARIDVGGRQYFPISFLKSMLWAEIWFKSKDAAKLTNAMLLIFIAGTCLPVFFYRPKTHQERLPLTLLVFLSIIGLAINRYILPITPAGDFRYTYFALSSFILLFGYHLAAIRKFGILYWGLYTAMLAFLVAGCAVYIGEYYTSWF